MKVSVPSFEIDDLPGAELLREALHDSGAGSVTISSCLLSIAKPRLERAGLPSPAAAGGIPEAELTLYRLLMAEGGDAFGRYQALLRRLVSFEQALEHRVRQQEHEHAADE